MIFIKQKHKNKIKRKKTKKQDLEKNIKHEKMFLMKLI